MRLPTGVLLVFTLPLAAKTTGTVEGRVVNALTHAGISGVIVTLGSSPPKRSTIYEATTDASGVFRIDDVPEGDYVPWFTVTGFTDMGILPWQGRKPFHLAKGDTVRLPVELVPLGTLRGRVLDGEGHPVVKADVELAHLRGARARIATTDVDGRFELKEAGAFTLMARPVAKQKGPTRSSSDKERSASVPTYFPGGIQRMEAARIVLRPGEEQEGYEIRLRTVPAYRIRGVVRDEEGKPAPRVPVRLVAPDTWSPPWEAQAVSGEDGAFEFPSVWARDWEFKAETKRGETVLKGFGSIMVSHDNVDGLVIRLSPPFTVKGFVEGPELRDERGNRSFGYMWLSPELGESKSGTRQADGTVLIEDVFPGRYTIMPAVTGRPTGYYLESVLFGARDVTGQAVDLVDGTVPIRVIFSPNPGRVSGTVENCRGETVVLWGLDEPILGSNYFHKTTCDASGRFEFTDLRPGDYYAYTFAQVGDADLLQDLTFARALKQRATKVRVEKGRTADIELKVVPWPE